MNTNFMLFAAAVAVATVLSVLPWGDNGFPNGSSLWNDSRIADDTAFTTSAPKAPMDSNFWKE